MSKSRQNMSKPFNVMSKPRPKPVTTVSKSYQNSAKTLMSKPCQNLFKVLSKPSQNSVESLSKQSDPQKPKPKHCHRAPSKVSTGINAVAPTRCSALPRCRPRPSAATLVISTVRCRTAAFPRPTPAPRLSPLVSPPCEQSP